MFQITKLNIFHCILYRVVRENSNENCIKPILFRRYKLNLGFFFVVQQFLYIYFVFTNLHKTFMNVCFSAVTGIQYMHGFCTVTQYFFPPQTEPHKQTDLRKRRNHSQFTFHFTLQFEYMQFCSAPPFSWISFHDKNNTFCGKYFQGYLTVSVLAVVRNIYIRSFSHDPHVLCGQENSYYIWIFRTVFQIM